VQEILHNYVCNNYVSNNKFLSISNIQEVCEHGFTNKRRFAPPQFNVLIFLRVAKNYQLLIVLNGLSQHKLREYH